VIPAFARLERTGKVMSNTALIMEMAILVGIFLLGFLAKMFPKKAANREQGSEIRADRSSSER
jgi:hypothetical protein